LSFLAILGQLKNQQLWFTGGQTYLVGEGVILVGDQQYGFDVEDLVCYIVITI
jgi:hypothetical protein